MSARKPGVPFEYFSHTADIGLIARGASMEEALANARRGLFDMMIEG